MTATLPLFSDLSSPVPAADNCEWYTPPHIIEAARATLGTIDLDPASCPEANRIVRATRIYTREDNGLKREWRGNLWLNPPYGRGILELFVERLLQWTDYPEFELGYCSGIVLTNSCTETGWWQRLALSSALLCFPRGRLRFWGPMEHGNNPTQGQSLFLLSRNPSLLQRFTRHFSPFGLVLPSH